MERKDRYHNLIHGSKNLSNMKNTTILDMFSFKNQNPEDFLIQQEMHIRLLEALDTLSEDDLFILSELFLEMKTFTVVGREMGVSVSAIRKRKLKALKNLRDLLIN